MRHRKTTVKLGRTMAHRNAMLSAQVCSLIRHGRIRTTLAKARASRRLAERMVTLAREGTLAARRHALAVLRQKEPVRDLFQRIAPAMAARPGGYTRIVKLPGKRGSDGAPMAILEWVQQPAPATPASAEEARPSSSSG